MRPRPTARFRCLACPRTWQAPAGPTECPACGGLYVVWLNYAELFDPDHTPNTDAGPRACRERSRVPGSGSA